MSKARVINRKKVILGVNYSFKSKTVPFGPTLRTTGQGSSTWGPQQADRQAYRLHRQAAAALYAGRQYGSTRQVQ